MKNRPRSLNLREYVTREFRREELSDTEAQAIWDRYRNQVSVDTPSFKNDYRWRLTSQGWVGFLPVTPHLGLRLRPKVPLANILGMFDYAYRLRSFRFLEGVTSADTLEEFYEQLANILSKRALDRARRGLYRNYVREADDLPFMRGSLMVRERALRPWSVRLPCEYEEHTADIEENQIIGWALERISRSGLCTGRVLPTVRRAYRTFYSIASIRPYRPEDCINRLYNRLNQDYHPLHSLCRFFLESTGPTHNRGDSETLPFMVDMGRLFELFVAEWLTVNLPVEYELRYQEKVNITDEGDLYFQIDQVLLDSRTGQVLAVIDTKYKPTDGPSASDVSQIVAYAESKGCTLGILVYPRSLPKPLDEHVGRIRVSTHFFDLGRELEEAGHIFRDHLLTHAQSGTGPSSLG